MGTRVMALSRRRRLAVSAVVLSTALAFLPGVAAPQQADAAEGVALSALVAADRVDVRTRWSSVEFATPFAEPPVVVAGPASWRGRDPVTIRVRNVTNAGFEIRLTEWPYLDGNHTVEKVSYLAVPAGRHVLASGAVIEAGTTTVGESLTGIHRAERLFGGAPVVLSTVVSAAAGPALAERIRLAIYSLAGQPQWSILVHLQAEEATTDRYRTGDVNWVAWSPGHDDGSSGDIAWETHDPLINNSFARVFFGRAYARPCVLADMNTMNGPDTANLRYRKLWPRSVRLRVDEEKSANPEVAHVAERVGILVLECTDRPPTIEPDFEFGDTLVGTPTVLSGLAFDDGGVERVSLAIRHRTTGTWLQADGSLGPQIRRFDADLAHIHGDRWRWTYAVSLADGDYSLSVRAWDTDGNEVALAPWRHFTVAAPSASGTILAEGTGFSSIELDPAGNPVIAYVDSDSVNLLRCSDPGCASFSGPFEVLPYGFVPEWGSEEWNAIDLELDAAANPVISYGSAVAHCVDPNCQLPAIRGMVAPGEGTSMELDAVGYPVVSGGYGLTVAHCVDANCVDPPVVASGFGFDEVRWTSLALDALGNPVVASWDWYGEGNAPLSLLHCSDPFCLGPSSNVELEGGYWETDGAVSMVLDTDGYPVMAVMQLDPEGTGPERLRVKRCSDANCAGPVSTMAIVENQYVGLHSSLALSASGFPIVAHNDIISGPATGDLILARCTDALCADPVHRTIVDNTDILPGWAPAWVSLAVGAADTAYISYLDGYGNLRFARVPAP
ncbi:H-type lectin domain-containing protein [Actinomycetota bacterium]